MDDELLVLLRSDLDEVFRIIARRLRKRDEQQRVYIKRIRDEAYKILQKPNDPNFVAEYAAYIVVWADALQQETVSPGKEVEHGKVDKSE